ncbi:MAG: radical SAM family heme chaperone HemW [Nitrospirae bacterium]|nr:radical SAM family heme chaperone HemW [Nitrospirota bacterium]
MAEYVYIHIPFCVKKCIYCDFLSMPYDESLALRYTDALCSELQMKKGSAERLKTVFLGGGTPSILPEECLDRILACISENYSLTDHAEITVEANPGTLTEAKLRIMLSGGVNRLSLGVQSFQDRELKTLGRIHSADEAIRSAEMVLSAGLVNFSLDLMYGIPGQSIKTWKNSLDQAVALAPRHISAYELTPEQETPLKRALDARETRMPDEELILEMSDLAIDHLAASGYEQYEISNYALPGYHCIHNMNYWDRGNYLGVGAGAHGFIRGFRTRNISDIAEYLERLSENADPEVERTGISSEDALKEFVFLGLRKVEGIRLADASQFGLGLAAAGEELLRLDLTEMTEHHFRLTRKGRHIANEVIVRLLEGLGL